MYRPRLGYCVYLAIQLFSCKYVTIKLSWVEYMRSLHSLLGKIVALKASSEHVALIQKVMSLKWLMKNTLWLLNWRKVRVHVCCICKLWTLKTNTQDMLAYVHPPTPANAPKDLRGYWTKVHEICIYTRCKGFIVESLYG